MRKSPLMKENMKAIQNQKFSYLNKSKQKTSSLEKSSYSNRSLLNEMQHQTPNQPKKNISTQASDQKLHNQSQILKSLMKIQNRTNPILTQQNCYAGVKLNFNNCIGNEEKRMNTNQYNSLNQTIHPSPKLKTISLSTYTSTQSPELREKEIRHEQITQFKQLITQTKLNLENIKISDMQQYIERIFDETIQPLLQLKSEMLKQIEKCINAEQYQIRSTIESLKKMEDDILSNEFNIIEFMAMGPFNEIMQIYQKRFKEHSIFVQQLNQQDIVIHQFKQLHDNFTQQNHLLCKQLQQSLQTYLSLYISFQNKDDFYEMKEFSNIQQQNQFINNLQENLFQTCETNNSIDEDQVIMKDQQVVRIPDKTSQFTQLLMKGLNCQKSLFPSESPQFKN
ncbi:unnamed protein product [Paramecium pentaurelia]|uniref:Uncharacterized protein n=1 Tax=Paramecium pentaurelia TaxID=43138 RepID=A0A8S1WYX9_9CILI|nr:unnamed protein product [Paramecium pentaurelia]